MDNQTTVNNNSSIHNQYACMVGDPATVRVWSDRRACTVVEVSSDGKKIVVQQDIATRVDKNYASESQSYEYECNPNGTRYTFTLRKNGRFVQLGCRYKNGLRLSVGHRSEYYDYSC